MNMPPLVSFPLNKPPVATLLGINCNPDDALYKKYAINVWRSPDGHLWPRLMPIRLPQDGGEA